MKGYTPMNWVRRKTWIGIVLIAIGVLGWWVGEMKKTYAEAKARAAMQTKNTPRVLTTPAREQRFNERTISVRTETNSWSKPVVIPFGSKFMLNLKVPSLIKKNGKLYTYNGHTIFEPNGQESLGQNVESLEFMAIRTNATNEVLIWDVR